MMREPITGAWIEDDLILAQRGLEISKELLEKHGPVSVVNIMLEYYTALVSELVQKGMAIGL
jgi:hypothetical protein